MFELKIKTDNAAFCDESGDSDNEYMKAYKDTMQCIEVRRILQSVIKALEDGRTQGCCIDYNGNVVGEWVMK